MSKKKKGFIIGGVAVGAAALLTVPALMKEPELQTVRTVTLAPTTLSNTVSVTGTVQSSDTYQVYSTSAGLIDEVMVKVGDQVAVGDVLCQFDVEALEMTIAQSEASLDQTKNAAYLQLRSAQRNLDNAKSNLENGLNSTIISADSAVSSAKIGKQNAKLALESAENSVDNLEDALDEYRDAYKAARDAESKAGKAVKQYQDEYDKLIEEFDDQLNGLQKEIKDWQTTLKELEGAEEYLNDCQEEVDKRYEELVRLEEDIDELEAKLEDPEISDAERSQLKSDLNDLEALFEEKSNDEGRLIANRDAAQKEYDDLQNEIGDIDPAAEIERLNKEYTAKLLESGVASVEAQYKLQAASEAYTAAASAKAQTQAALESASGSEDAAEMAVDQAQLGVKSANNSYNTALAQQEATQTAIEQQIKSYEDAVASAQLAGNTTVQELSLEQLYNQLEDATVTAPIAGTVTAVYAVEGAPSSGLLFIIENIDDLEITTSIKEYDVNSVKVGMPALIRTDAIDGAEFAGTLTEVAPTASKDAVAAATGSVIFDAVVDVDEKNTGLRVGMNTRMEILLESQEDVFGIPYDAVHTADDGSSFVVAVVEENGQQITRYIPVATGMETDFYIEIQSNELTEGLRIIATSDLIPEGTAVQVS